MLITCHNFHCQGRLLTPSIASVIEAGKQVQLSQELKGNGRWGYWYYNGDECEGQASGKGNRGYGRSVQRLESSSSNFKSVADKNGTR